MIGGTIDLATAEQTLWDAVVVGAGPAGCVAAIGLARAGLKTLLIDRTHFPRDKVCGGCLNSDALSDLDRLGLATAVSELGGFTIKKFLLAQRRTRATLDLPAGMAVSRRALDALLVQKAIANGSHFLPGQPVRIDHTNLQAETRLLHLGSDGTVAMQSRMVVLATGLSTAVCVDEAELPVLAASTARIGMGTTACHFPSFYEPGTIYMAVGRSGYVGLTRVEGHSLNIAAALDLPRVRASSPARVCREILEQAEFAISPEMLEGPWRGTASLTRNRPQVASHRIFAVGDAASYIEPFTGEGMAWAIRGGCAVVPLVVRGVQNWSPALMHEWATTLNQHLARRHRWCRTFARVLRHPKLVRAALFLTAAMPPLGRAVVRSIHLESYK